MFVLFQLCLCIAFVTPEKVYPFDLTKTTKKVVTIKLFVLLVDRESITHKDRNIIKFHFHNSRLLFNSATKVKTTGAK